MAGGDLTKGPPVLPEEDPTEELPEQLIGQLDDSDNDEIEQPNSQLQDSLDRFREAYSQPKNDKDQQLEESRKQELHNKEVEQSRQQADKIKSGKQLVEKNVTKSGNEAAASTLKDKGTQAAERSVRASAKAFGEATSKAAKQAARAIGQTVKKAVTQLLTKNPWFWVVVGVILLLLIIILVAIALFSYSSDAGKGPAIYPSTVSQQEQTTLLSALSGDQIANNKVVAETIKDEKERYQLIKKNAQHFSPNLVASIDSKIAEFEPLLDSLLKTANKVERKKILIDLQKRMLEFEGTLPFGSWISQIALGHQNEGSLNFCKITKAGAKVACASFVSTVLWESGVPNPIQASVDAVWGQKSTRIVVDRPAIKSAEYYNQNKSKLRPGDLVFWGDGTCSKGGSTNFDHIGIYVGSDQAVDNSSSKEKILKRNAASRSSCRVFNAAKRYGADS